MRQPQECSASSSRAETGMKASEARVMPAAMPDMDSEGKNPRSPTGDSSVVRVDAPAISAPADMP